MSDSVLHCPSPSHESLSRRTARGFIWLTMQTLGSKAAAVTGQILLARLLMPTDFGLWATTTAILEFTGLIQRAGLRETLIHRHRTYHLWANSAFWMSVGLGMISLIVTAALAWPAAWIFSDQRLIGMLLVGALAAPLMSLDQIAEARLQIQMRFGLLAGVNWSIAVIQQVLLVLLAWLLPDPYKPYAFVLPRPVLALARFAVLWPAASPPVRRFFQLARWKYLFTDSATVFFSHIAWMVQMNADYFVLGLLYPNKAVLGLYFLAFSLSSQTMQLVTGNLSGVMFPALSQLQGDPVRQIRTFLDATRGLALIAVPLCFLQLALADPVIRLLFQDAKWQDAIPVLQALSVGMAFRVVASPGGSLLQAQGRFRAVLYANCANAAFFVLLVTAGGFAGVENASNVWLKPATTVAIAAAIYFAVVCPIFLYVAICTSGGTWRDIWRLYSGPIVCSLLAVAPAMLLGNLVPVEKIRSHRLAHATRALVILAWSLSFYIPLVKMAAPQTWHNLVHQLARLFRSRRVAPVTAETKADVTAPSTVG